MGGWIIGLTAGLLVAMGLVIFVFGSSNKS